MHHEESHFSGAGGLELYCQCWRPESEPRVVVALVHGVGEHSGRYANVVGPLVEDGYAVYGYDQRGHGQSPGPRVHIDRWAQYRDDLSAYLGMVAGQARGRPIVVYGHSMGALVVLDCLLEHPKGLAGAIISGVPLQPAGIGKPYQVAMARMLSGVVPRMTLDLRIGPGSLTRDPRAIEAVRADPLVTSRATMRWGTESLATVRRIREGMADIDLPLLVLHGGADRLNLPEGAQELFETVSSPDKTLRIYPDVHHEPHNDLGHEQVAADVKEWLDHLTRTWLATACRRKTLRLAADAVDDRPQE
jgi:alpha-beta hydrolase superfamily lysophospholipase